MVSELIGSAIQLVIFGAVPFIWWFFTARHKENFFNWIGLKKIDHSKGVLFPTIITAIVFMILGYSTLYMIRDVKTAAASYAGQGTAGIPVVIIYSLIHTSLSEELLFRGFLLKRISDKFGFTAGNFIQAVLFGMLHGIMFFEYTGIVRAFIIVLFTGAIGFVMGYINEKKANGSILPSWFIHFICNLFTGMLSLFSVL
jgi:membrane protease YdiL (CAAX protease family)